MLGRRPVSIWVELVLVIGGSSRQKIQTSLLQFAHHNVLPGSPARTALCKPDSIQPRIYPWRLPRRLLACALPWNAHNDLLLEISQFPQFRIEATFGDSSPPLKSIPGSDLARPGGP